MNKHYILLGTVVVTLLLTIVGLVAWVGRHYSTGIQFDPNSFITRLFEFGLDVVAVLLGFVLVQLIWSTKLRDEQREHSIRLMTGFFLQMAGLTENCVSLLEEKFLPGEGLQADERDERLLQLLASFTALKEGFLASYPDFDLYGNPVMARAITDIFWDRIIPIIHDLAAQKRIRGVSTELREKLLLLNSATWEAIHLLRACSHETGGIHDNQSARR